MAEEFENINEQPDVQEPKETLKEKVDDLKDKVDDLKEKVEEKAEEFKDKAEEAYEKVKSEIDDVTDEIDPEDIKKNKIYAVLAYIGILVVIPIFFAKESKFAKFHANQGLILFLIELVVGLFLKKWILGIIEAVVFVFAVIGIVYAIQGKAKELPVIGNFKILK